MSFQEPNLTPEGKAEMAAIIREAIKDKRAIAIARVQIIVMARAELTTEQGRVINEPSVKLCCGIEVSKEFRPLGRDSLCPSGAAFVSTMPAPSGFPREAGCEKINCTRLLLCPLL